MTSLPSDPQMLTMSDAYAQDTVILRAAPAVAGALYDHLIANFMPDLSDGMELGTRINQHLAAAFDAGEIHMLVTGHMIGSYGPDGLPSITIALHEVIGETEDVGYRALRLVGHITMPI